MLVANGSPPTIKMTCADPRPSEKKGVGMLLSSPDHQAKDQSNGLKFLITIAKEKAGWSVRKEVN